MEPLKDGLATELGMFLGFQVIFVVSTHHPQYIIHILVSASHMFSIISLSSFIIAIRRFFVLVGSFRRLIKGSSLLGSDL